MRLTCEYCGSYVDVGTEANCPLCGAPMGDAIRAAEAQKKAEADRLAAEAAKRAEEEAEQRRNEQLMQTISNIAGVAAGTLIGSLSSRSMRGLGSMLFRGPKRPGRR